MNKHRIGRNDPCPCGSGKKYKKCCDNKRPRTQSLLVGYKEPFKGVTVKNGEIVAIILPSGERIKPDALFTQTDYTRKNGREKVLNIIPDIATINTTLYLTSEFRGIFAIDTGNMGSGLFY